MARSIEDIFADIKSVGIAQMSIEEYHGNPTHVSASKLNDLRRFGPVYYRAAYIDKTLERQKNQGLVMGQLFDDYMTSDGFNDKYVVAPSGLDMRTKEGKAWKEANQGKTVVASEDFQCIIRMAESVKTHAAELLSMNPEKQVTIRAHTSRFTLLARPDLFVYRKREPVIVIDIKTTSDILRWLSPYASRQTVAGPIIDYGYHRQAALASKLASMLPGVGSVEHRLIVVETQPPHRCRVFKLSDAYLSLGWRSIAKDIEYLDLLFETGDFTDPYHGTIQIDPPDWAVAQEDQEEPPLV